ncbi:MAG: DNA gyrase subunit A [Candidatus Thermofonsia Clade 1 bacterium]|uniref:DNA topoisomerase (ATP-hydrolyzing) n=1 Tax=Candidatus Thermofonsia Clade 1 bacterium TaxID=2364210 RepID=A0A2M8NYV0_9CHLR|nr:MAG: DNA gyrase subunit A [Candidatus Thermofonsia Clade 1 bacterium]
MNIDEQMREAYLDYAMSVIVARALPDARDGLKPVQRRILYVMHEMGLRPEAPYKKSARIVGEVLGKFHPHGDQAIYEAMARLAQDFSVRYELVDGQGNFGSIDGDSPAAMRYTEARLTPIGMELLTDIDRETVDFVDNFDGSLQEPAVLPAAIPNLLINGSSGIAVGMSTNVPPHNLGEVCDALVYMLANWERLDEIDVHDLMRFIKGPDFPTGGLLYRGGDGKNATEYEDMLVAAYATGRGKLTLRAKVHIESLERGKTRIIVSEIPYQINKNSLLERIADLVRDGKIDGISDLRDESDRQGLRVVIECKSNADPAAVLKDLFKYTPLQSTFGVIMLALVDGEPRTLTLKQALRVYLDYRFEVVRRRSLHDLERARARAHILEGLLIALRFLDRVIRVIRESENSDEARGALMYQFGLSEAQASAILDLQLRRLAALEQEKIQSEYREKQAQIAYLEQLLANPKLMRKVIADELRDIKKRYADPRRTTILSGAAADVRPEDLLAHSESTWVALTHSGKISRTYQDAPPKITAQTQDPPRFLLRSNTADILYLFTADGRAATIPVQNLPLTDEPSEGGDVISMCDLRESGQVIGALSLLPSFKEGYLFLATENGDVKRVRIADLPALSARAVSIINLGEDRLVAAHFSREEDEAILVTAEAQAIRFKLSEVRPMGLAAGGVRGIRLNKSDKVVSAQIVRAEGALWTVTENGAAKSSPMAEYPVQGRGGAGGLTMRLMSGDRIAAAVIGTPMDLVIVLTAHGRFRVVKFRDAPHGRRDLNGDLIGIRLSRGDRVCALMQIVARPEPLPIESPNGASDPTV